VFGFSEKMINQIEREMHLAELDEKDRYFAILAHITRLNRWLDPVSYLLIIY